MGQGGRTVEQAWYGMGGMRMNFEIFQSESICWGKGVGG